MNQTNDVEFAPPGRLIGIAGVRLHIHAQGAGRPPVVFEAVGLSTADSCYNACEWYAGHYSRTIGGRIALDGQSTHFHPNCRG